jgi:hypothetical protein
VERNGHSAVEGSCEYIEKAAMDKRQGMVLQLGDWAWGEQPHTIKINLLRNINMSHGLGHIP